MSKNKQAALHQTPENGAPQEEVFALRLFVTGASPNSARAINNLKAICEAHLAGQYTLEIIDVHQQPDKAAEEQLIALPLLVKKAPLPERRLIGDLSDTAKVLRIFGL